MKPICLIFAIPLIFSACNQEANKATSAASITTEQTENGMVQAVKTIDTDEAKALLEKEEDLVILDVRTPEEYAGGHLKNAVLLNKYDADFETRIQDLDREKPYLVYCAMGGRSGETKALMQKLGFKKVYDTKGFEDLKNAGLPVEN
ncbi:rhodanese-like domain-containing protein [Adhaeribacter terreus]|uniref:Rhodanese-like domain-containing protein n=1 Tax=Adhaeribacter terreus TaxID=529703 RepID=A0ABW0E9R8_9BACT